MDRALVEFTKLFGREAATIDSNRMDGNISQTNKLNVQRLIAENMTNGAVKGSNLPLQHHSESIPVDQNQIPDYLKPKDLSEIITETEKLNTENIPNSHNIPSVQKNVVKTDDDKQLWFDFDKVIKPEDIYNQIEKINKRIDRIIENENKLNQKLDKILEIIDNSENNIKEFNDENK